MKNRKKWLIALVLTAVITTVTLIGWADLIEQTVRVWDETQQSSTVFEAKNSIWYNWACDHHGGSYSFYLRRMSGGSNLIAIEGATSDQSGTVELQTGTHYLMWADDGSMSLPGHATCTITTNEVGGDNPNGP